MTDDQESTTVVLKRVAPGLAWLPRILRDRLTPATLWGGVVALAVAITWLVNALSDIHRLKESVTDLQKDRELLQSINTNLAVMGSKVDSIALEVDRQREWRERIESEAESPPHSSMRKHR